jgi:hypothetical protein
MLPARMPGATTRNGGSLPDKDYAHVLGARMTGAIYTVLSLSGSEANYRGFDPASLDIYLQPPPISSWLRSATT